MICITKCEKIFDHRLGGHGPLWPPGSATVRERIPDSGRRVEEATRTDCFSSRSRDDEKTLLEPGWTQGGASGRYSHRDAVVGEVPGSQPVEALGDKKADLDIGYILYRMFIEHTITRVSKNSLQYPWWRFSTWWSSLTLLRVARCLIVYPVANVRP